MYVVEEEEVGIQHALFPQVKDSAWNDSTKDSSIQYLLVYLCTFGQCSPIRGHFVLVCTRGPCGRASHIEHKLPDLLSKPGKVESKYGTIT